MEAPVLDIVPPDIEDLPEVDEATQTYRIALDFTFSSSEADETWKKAGDLIRSAEAKGLRVISGSVTEILWDEILGENASLDEEVGG